MKPAIHARDHRPGGSDPLSGYLHWGSNFDTDNLGLTLDMSQGAFPGFFSLIVAGSSSIDFDGDSSAPVNWDVGAYTIETNGGQFFVDTDTGGAQFVNGPFEVQTGTSDATFLLQDAGDIFSVTDDDEVRLKIEEGAGIDLVSMDGGSGSFDEFGVRSIQLKAGNSSAQGTITLQAYDNQGTPAIAKLAVGRVIVGTTPYDGVIATLAAGQTLSVTDDTGAALFEVWEDGTVHIQTGATITADL